MYGAEERTWLSNAVDCGMMMVAYESNITWIWRPIEYQNENENEWIMRGGLLIALSFEPSKKCQGGRGAPC